MADGGRTWRTWQVLATAGVALLLGVGIGAAGSDDKTTLSAAGSSTTSGLQISTTVAPPPTTAATTTTAASTTTTVTTPTTVAPTTTRGTTGILSSTPPPTAASGPRTVFGNGQYRVGTDIAPGTYIAPGGNGCYWERQRTFGGAGVDDIIANDLSGGGQVVVTISASDRGFKTSGCGTWTPG